MSIVFIWWLSLFFSQALCASSPSLIFLIRIRSYVTKSYSLCLNNILECWRKAFQNAVCSISSHKVSANSWNYPAPNRILSSSIIILPLTTYTQKIKKKLWKLSKAQKIGQEIYSWLADIYTYDMESFRSIKRWETIWKKHVMRHDSRSEVLVNLLSGITESLLQCQQNIEASIKIMHTWG